VTDSPRLGKNAKRGWTHRTNAIAAAATMRSAIASLMDLENSVVDTNDVTYLPTPLRHAARRLLRAPAVSSAAILTLTLGLGAETTTFAVVRSVLLRPLPYPA